MEEGRRRKRKNKFSFLGCKYFTQELSNGQKGTDAILFPSSATYPAYQVEKIKLQMSLCVNINKKPSPVFEKKLCPADLSSCLNQAITSNNFNSNFVQKALCCTVS